MVEKKSPLVMPPDFDELPMPNENQNTKKNEATDIKSLIATMKIPQMKLWVIQMKIQALKILS